MTIKIQYGFNGKRKTALLQDNALEYEAEFTLHDTSDIIADPGKFEEEPLYVPYFWNLLLNGMSDPDDSFEIEDSEHQAFPDLCGFTRICLCEDDNGFIYHELQA